MGAGELLGMSNRLDVDNSGRGIFLTVTRPTAFFEAREHFEKSYIVQTLSKHKWNVTRAASEMGIDRPYLYELMRKYNLKRPE